MTDEMKISDEEVRRITGDLALRYVNAEEGQPSAYYSGYLQRILKLIRKSRNLKRSLAREAYVIRVLNLMESIKLE